MYTITTEASFDSAHFLKGYQGKCHNLHGHRWRVLITVATDELQTNEQNNGMVYDFGDIKKVLKAECDDLDHCLIYEKGSMKASLVDAMTEENFRLYEVPFRPTAENFAKYFFDKMKEAGFPVYRTEVFETPNNSATYEEGPCR